VILKGRPVGVVQASDYYEQYFDRGWQTITECLEYLTQEFDVLVCEGAGSPAEINLKHRDLTNMRVAQYLNAKTLLVVDIDRGGAFAHVVGTLQLLDPEERALIKGIIINKFRGQRSLLEPGIKWLEEYTGIPVVAVIPWIDSPFPAEDSLSLFERRTSSSPTELTIAIIRFPRIANFTDFDPLDSESSVKIKYVAPSESLGHPDAVILPGSKTTIADLQVLKQSGMANQIKNYVAAGGQVMGICGGYQMLGKMVSDPYGLEGQSGDYEGLGLLPIKTIIAHQKTSRQRLVSSHYPQEGLPVSGYEIHQGRSRLIEPEDTHSLFDDPNLGLVNQAQSIWGTYLHGIFDNGPWRRAWLNRLRQQRGLKALPTGVANYREQREQTLDNLATEIESYLDLTTVLS